MSASPTRWQKAQRSGGGGENCVELALTSDGTVQIRESDDPGRTITTSRENLAAFFDGVKAGEFDHLVR
ncbi:DUF397 domain-containing protein [Streptomyces griseoviridis]|uniref:DUF397 domain-containing protein n=1 Tax=Streptomyces griseoviridis TaxID=45398 RepID=UPI00343244A0